MGKSKELFMQEREKEENIQQPVCNNTGCSVLQNKMWEIKSIKDDCVYRIWAPTYKEAVEMLPIIESF
jgi:hypothetical protein